MLCWNVVDANRLSWDKSEAGAGGGGLRVVQRAVAVVGRGLRVNLMMAGMGKEWGHLRNAGLGKECRTRRWKAGLMNKDGLLHSWRGRRRGHRVGGARSRSLVVLTPGGGGFGPRAGVCSGVVP